MLLFGIIENLNLELNKNKEILQSKTNNELNVKTGDIDQIIDAGLLKDVLKLVKSLSVGII